MMTAMEFVLGSRAAWSLSSGTCSTARSARRLLASKALTMADRNSAAMSMRCPSAQQSVCGQPILEKTAGLLLAGALNTTGRCSLLRAFAVWLAIITVETVHGVLRGLLLVPLVGDLPARQVGVPIGSLLLFAVACLCTRWIAATTKLQLLGVGLFWVVLTVLFEVGLGRL